MSILRGARPPPPSALAVLSLSRGDSSQRRHPFYVHVAPAAEGLVVTRLEHGSAGGIPPMIWSDSAFLALRDFSLSSTQTLSSLGLSGKTFDHVSEVEVARRPGCH